MNRRLFAAMLGLLYPPRASAIDQELVEAVNRNTAAACDVVAKAAKIDRAMQDIEEATEGLFV